VLKVMTTEQRAGFRLLREAARPSTHLIEAPAGSGKTLIAVKLVADNLRASLETGSDSPALLLAHTRGLQKHLLCELKDELLSNAPEAEELRPGLVALRMDGLVAFVATVDALAVECAGETAQTEAEVAAALRAYGGEVRGVGLAVVDEGHHVFARQPNAALSGQTRFADAARVRQVLAVCLAPKHKLLIFHDHLYQRDGALPSYPPYIPPDATGEQKLALLRQLKRHPRFLTTVVRLPAAARDVAMPFCRERVDVESSDGRVDFYPLLDERTHGEFVPVDVPYRGAFVDPHVDDYLSRVEKRGSLAQESAAHEAAYAEALAAQLESLAEEIGTGGWGKVAVLVPSTVPGWPGTLRDATAGHLQSEGVRAALASATDSDVEGGFLWRRGAVCWPRAAVRACDWLLPPAPPPRSPRQR